MQLYCSKSGVDRINTASSRMVPKQRN